MSYLLFCFSYKTMQQQQQKEFGLQVISKSKNNKILPLNIRLHVRVAQDQEDL